MGATVIEKAHIKQEGSIGNHLERRAVSLRSQVHRVSVELSRRDTGKPGPKPGLAAVKRAEAKLDEAVQALREAKSEVDDIS